MVSITQALEPVPQIKREVIKKMIEEGRRIDSRKLLEYRNLEIIINNVKTANGSSIISLGNTKVVTGVKLEIGEPFKDSPDEGALIVNLEIPPIAAPSIEPGPPDENAIEIARVVDRTIRHSGFIDLKIFSLIPGRKAWVLWVDLYVLNHDGNLIDASVMSVVTALACTRIPKVDVVGNDVRVSKEERVDIKVNLEKLPLTLTFVKINNNLIVDPVLEEEKITEGKYSVGIAGDKIVSIQKSVGTFSIEDIRKIMKTSLDMYKSLKDHVLNVIQSRRL